MKKQNGPADNASIIMDFDRLSGPDFASLVASIIAGITKNDYFPAVDPVVTIVQQQLDEYVTFATAAFSRYRTAVAVKSVARQLLTANVKGWGQYVKFTAAGMA